MQWGQIDIDDATAPAPTLGTAATPPRYSHPRRSDILVLDKLLGFGMGESATNIASRRSPMFGVPGQRLPAERPRWKPSCLIDRAAL